jgi:hypothetical protein
MKELRLYMVILVCATALFFNVERVDIFGFGENYINLAGIVYPIVAIAALTTIGLKFLARLHTTLLLGFWFAVWGGFTLYGGRHSGDEPIRSFIISMTEIAMLLSFVWVCHRASRSLAQFEKAVEDVTVRALGHRFIPLATSGERIQDEFQLSRRHELPLSLIVVEPDRRSMKDALDQMLKEAQRALMHVFANRSVATVITRTLRRTDLLLEADNPARFIVLCRDTDSAGSRVVQQRILEACSEDLGIEVAAGRACFPDDALTFEELMNKASTRMRENRKLAQQEAASSTENNALPA